MGLSVAVNACLVLLLIRAFAACSMPDEKYMAVELRLPAPVVTRQVTMPTIRQAEPPSPTKPVLQVRHPKQAPVRPLHSKPATAVLASKQEIRSIPMRPGIPRLEAPIHDTPQPGPIESAGDGEASSIPAGAPSRGPGVHAGHGDGGGSAHGSGSTPIAQGTGEVHRSRPAPVRETRLPANDPPKPAPPRGENRAAQLSRQVKPAYPPDAREEGAEGAVVLSISIGTDGKVTSAKVEKGSGDRRLDRAAVDAVRQWTYSPSLQDGTPVASSLRVRVEFRLE